jgi:hypothetical protein
MRHELRLAGGYSITVDTSRGQLTLRGANGAIGPATASLLVEEGREVEILRGARVRASATALELRFRAGAIEGSMRFRVRHGRWLTLETAVTNRTRQEVRLAHLDFLRLQRASGFDFGGSPRDLRLLSNPRGMGPFAGTRDLIPRKKPDVYDLGPIRANGGQPYERWNQSWMMVSVWDKRTRRGVVIGAAQPMHEGLRFDTEGEAFRARFFPDTRLLKPGMTAKAPEVQIDLVDPPREGVEAYAEVNRQRLRVKDLSRFAGWNSFDYYLNTERLSDILENADAMRKMPALRESVRWICVDSGWEYRWGEYYALEHRFPGGLPRLVRELRRRGLKTGVWTAPLLVERWATKTTRWDPEALVRNEQGDFLPVFNDHCFTIDPTHPAGERYLRELYTRLRREGVRYFKCDFLELGFTHFRNRYARHLSLTDINRRVLEIIREAIGPDCFLIACIECPEAAVGLADAIRISGDMHNIWSNAQLSAVNTVWRWWWHGKFFFNDPDMIPVRGPQTAKQPLGAYSVERPFQDFKGDTGPLFTRREAELWMSFCLLSGGLFSLCDRMSHLDSAGRRIVSIGAKNLSQVAGKPIDFYDAGLPALYLQPDRAVTRLGVFNWYDRPRKIRVHTDGLLDIPRGTVLGEVWTGRKREWDGPFTVTLPPRSCLYFRFATPIRR